MLNDLSAITRYTYFPGGGLILITKSGKEQKIAFKHKSDFNIVFDYLKKHLAKHEN